MHRSHQQQSGRAHAHAVNNQKEKKKSRGSNGSFSEFSALRVGSIVYVLFFFSEHENLVNEMQTTSSKITQYIMDWQLQSNLQMLKINVFDSERLEEKLCEQACQLKEMSLKMENLVLEKTTIENEKANQIKP